MALFPLALLAALVPFTAVAGASCNADNCLRALRATQRLEAAQSFCTTFTTAQVSETTGIPQFALAGCTGFVASRLSSACSCLPTPPTSATTASQSTTATSTPISFPGATPKTCASPELSCHSTSVNPDTCCYNTPGGQLLLTQFWDTAPSTGPNNSWTLHGLWPDHCDGTYDANCDAAREYTNITDILKSHGKTDVLAYMKTYWKDYQGNDESFWEHEWDKHGTCISTLEPKCYTGYTKQAEVADYFQIATDLFKGLDSYTILANAGVTPSTTKSYALAEIANPLRAYHGYDVTIQCSSSALNEIWYHYNVLGNVQAKNSFVPTSPDGSKGSCPATGIKYTPKYLDTTTPSNPGTTVPFVGKGFLRAYTNGTNQGFLISGGTWYPNSGTPAGYTVATVDNGFTLTTSKGACTAVAGTGLLGCAAGNTASVFSAVNSTLAYRGQTTFYADAVPTGIIQAKVYTVGTSHPVEVSFRWATS